MIWWRLAPLVWRPVVGRILAIVGVCGVLSAAAGILLSTHSDEPALLALLAWGIQSMVLMSLPIALLAFSPTEELALEAAPFVRALAIPPGPLATAVALPMMPLVAAAAIASGSITWGCALAGGAPSGWAEITIPQLRCGLLVTSITLLGFGIRVVLGRASPMRNGGFVVALLFFAAIFLSRIEPDIVAAAVSWLGSSMPRLSDLWVAGLLVLSAATLRTCLRTRLGALSGARHAP